MRVSVWYRDEEKRPAQSGWYLAHRGFGMGGMGDGDRELGYLYYDAQKKRWLESEMSWGSGVVGTVYYWADMNTNEWIEEDGPSIHIREKLKDPRPSVKSAWAAVEEALSKYRMLVELTR